MRNRTRTTIAAATIAGLALAGCSAPETEPAPEPTATAEQTTPAPEAERVPVPVEPEQADPTPGDEGTYNPGPQVIGPPEAEAEQYELSETDRLYLLDVRLQVPDSETRAELMSELTADEAQLMAAVDAAATHHYCPQGGTE